MAATNKQLTVVNDYLQKRLPRIRELMPTNSAISAEKLCRVTLLAINTNPTLLTCSPESIYAAMLESARLGLEIGGAMPHAYLVPYKGKAQFQVGYRGMIELVIRSGSAKDVNIEYVHEGDTFQREMGIHGKWTHIANNDPKRESNPITHVYVEFLLPDDRIKRHVMTTEEINDHAARYSQAVNAKDGPWKTAWKAMAAKTVIKQPILRGLLPISLPDNIKKHITGDDHVVSLQDVVESLPALEPPTKKRAPKKDAKKAEVPEKVTIPLDPESLNADLNGCDHVAAVETIRTLYLGDSAAEDEDVIHDLCNTRIEELEGVEA
jgi:recombination protein RecT